jgi:hypothetical protein
MKNVFSIFLLIFLSIYNVSIGQDLNSTDLTPNGRLDNVFDRYGKKIPLSDLLIDKKGGGTKSIGPLCSSGYFDLYFEVGSGMEGNSPIELARRAVVCQVFSDLSQFIETPNPSIHVNILIKNINTELSGFNPTTNPNPAASSNVLGLATSYYVLPSLGPNIIGGIADNEIWKTINSGIDSYTNVASPLSSTSSSNNGSGYYHGMVALNFNNPSINWHLNLSQNTSNGLYDLYSVILHEVTHALGFASLINVNGNSKFGTNFPYYSRYDLFLKSPSNQPLITNTGNCSLYNYGFNPSLNTSILTPSSFSCSTHVKFGGSINQATYTPTIFANESSLSHLEDQCHLPNNYANDEYYVMSNANGTGPFYMKRYLKPEERSVLCDIGYKVNPNFGNTSNLNFYDYGTSICPGKDIVGINDGIDANGFVQYLTTVNNISNPLSITDICTNDYNTVSFECLQDIYGNGYPINITSTSFSYVATSPGMAVLRYVPISATGVRGNITYVYIYVSANNCPPAACNYLSNGDFELTTDCGQMDYAPSVNSACWSPLSNSPDLFLRGCTNQVSNWFFSCNIPTFYGSYPTFEAWNGTTNNSFLGIGSLTNNINESAQTQLNTPLIPGHTYTISLYARCGNNYGGVANQLPLGSSGQLLFGGTSNYLATFGGPQTVLPNSIIQLGTTESVVNDLNWHLITQTFQYNGQSNLNHLVIYNASNLNTNGQYYVYLYIDQIELTEVQGSVNLTIPPVLCLNQTINDLSLYAPIPGGTFSGPGVTSNGNISSFNPQTAGAGTHTISYAYTNNINCLVTISQQIVVVNSTFTTSINASNTQICSGQPVTLTAISSSPATYTWNPGNLTGAIINPIINASSLFTLTATNSQGCIATSSINLIVNPCNDCLGGTLLSGTITSSPSIGATLRIANDITISGNITFSANNVKIMPGVTINVTSNSTLTINGSHFYGCENMWKGIKVQAGGKVILQPYIVANVIQKTALIEDAIIGIDYLPITTQQNAFVLSSNNATFNKNGTAIRLQSYLFNNVSSVFEVKNSLFTSRNLYSTVNSTWPLTSTVKAASTPVNPLISPYIPNSYSLSNLKYPMNTIRAQIGLDLNDIGKTIIATPIVYNSLVIGSAIATEYIVFDNLKVGIYSFNSNVKIQNTILQITENLSINSFNSTPIGTPALGTGIFSKSDNLHINKLEVAGTSSLPNQFYGLSTAVITDNIKDVQCYYNTIRSNRSNMPNYLTLSNGERGIYIREVNKLVNIQVNYNTFYSINKGMSLIADVAGTAPTVNILNNVFKKSSTELSGIVLSSYAVLLDNSNSTNLMAGGNIWVNNNTIFNTISGIKLNSWKRITQQINNNSITFGNNSTVDMFGIKLVNSLMGAINTQIYNNSVIGAVAYSSQNSQYRAIAIEASIGNDLKCNDVRNAYSGLYFSSNCNPSKTSNNTMTNHKYGFVLDNNGIIGQQGSSTIPADNVWSGSTWDATGTANGRFKTACLYFSYAYNSPMYVRNNNNSYSPFGSVYNSLNSTPYSVSQLPQSLFIIFNTTPPTACAITSLSPINALTTMDVVNALESTLAYIGDTNTLTSDSILLTDQVYRTLDADTSIMQYSTILTEFYDSTAIKDFGTLLNVEVALAKDSTQMATTLNDVVIPDNQVEESYRLYYESYINYQNGAFNEVDSLNIRTLAEGCPVIQGSAVYMAEALYNVVYYEAELFTPICPDYIDKNAQILTNQSTLSTFTIYPVPNNGDFTLTGQITKGQTITIKTMDGKVVYTMRVEENTELQTIHTSLESGVYFVLIEDESNHLLSRIKFIVTK